MTKFEASNFRRDLRITLALALSDFRRRHAGSYFGIAWSFIQPIITIMVFWFVFQAGLRTQSVQGVPFLVWLVCGIVPWFFFTEAVSGAANSLFEYSYLVKKIVFKVELLPLVKIVAASFVHFVFLALVIVLMATFAVTPTLAAVQIAYYFTATMVLVIAVSTMTVALTPFFRDLTQMVSIALQFGMWMTPIMWDDSRLPEHYRWIVFINPMTYIVEGYRDAIIRGRWFWEKPMETVYFWMFVSVLFLVGGRLFTRLRPHFADVL